MAWARPSRSRMHGWRTNQPTQYFAAGQPQPLNILPGPPVPVPSYILDLAGAYLTDNAGNRLIYG